MPIKYARKFSFFILWQLYVRLLGNRPDTVLCEPVTNPTDLRINDEVRKDARIASSPSTGVRLY